MRESARSSPRAAREALDAPQAPHGPALETLATDHVTEASAANPESLVSQVTPGSPGSIACMDPHDRHDSPDAPDPVDSDVTEGAAETAAETAGDMDLPVRGREAQPDSTDEPCSDLPLTQRVEAVLLCSDRPLTDAKIASILGLAAGRRADSGSSRAAEVHAAIEDLNRDYAQSGRAFRIEAVAGGRQILTLPALGPLMTRLRAVRGEGRLSAAALETLAIVAYRQPILRADVESIRGVACGEVLRTLMERRLVRIVGRAEELGRPMLYGTTREFLRVFGLARIDDLPKSGDLPS